MRISTTGRRHGRRRGRRPALLAAVALGLALSITACSSDSGSDSRNRRSSNGSNGSDDDDFDDDFSDGGGSGSGGTDATDDASNGDGAQGAPGLWVAVGDLGTIRTSADGSTWTRRESGTEESLRDVAYDPQAGWIAVGVEGTVLTSEDGEIWTPQESGTEDLLQRVERRDGEWVAHPFTGALTAYSSPDGVTWEAFEQPSYAGTSGPGRLTDLATDGQGTWLGIGEGGTYAGLIARSEDGEAFEGQASSPGFLTGLTYGDGQWVAVGARGGTPFTATSPDGTTWTNTDLPDTEGLWNPFELSDIAYDGTGRWVLVAEDGAIYSGPNPTTWTRHTVQREAFLYGIAFAPQ